VKVQPVFDKIAEGDSNYQYSPENDQAKVQKLYSELVDSLLEEAQSKKIYSLSKDYVSIDSTNIKENKLQWAQLSANNYGSSFMDTIVTCKVGDVKKVFIPTEQGGIYAIIKVRKFGVKSQKMQIGTIIKNVFPGDKTQEDAMSRANQVAFIIKEGKDLLALSDSLNFIIDSSNVKGSTYNLKGISESRKIIYWAFNAEFNEPSNVFTTPNKYVVGVVRGENNDKYKPLNDPYVKSVCEAFARKEKQKAKILENFPAVNEDNIQSLATAYDAIVIKKESSVNLKRGSSEFSREFEVNGNIAGLTKDKTSNIIEGEEGVFVVKVINEYDAKITEGTSLILKKIS
jgi:peptidyl-prolyl cis-trans isomerase D